MEKEQVFLRQFEEAKNEIEAMRAKERDLTKKLEDLENNQVIVQSKAGLRKQQTVVAQTPSAGAQQKAAPRPSEYFKRLSMSSLNRRESSARMSQAPTPTAGQAFSNNPEL